MSSKKGPINLNKNTRDRFNRFRNWYSAKENKSFSQDNFLRALLDLFEKQNPEIKTTINNKKGEEKSQKKK